MDNGLYRYIHLSIIYSYSERVERYPYADDSNVDAGNRDAYDDAFCRASQYNRFDYAPIV